MKVFLSRAKDVLHNGNLMILLGYTALVDAKLVDPYQVLICARLVNLEEAKEIWTDENSVTIESNTAQSVGWPPSI
jgi:hypothetical protein